MKMKAHIMHSNSEMCQGVPLVDDRGERSSRERLQWTEWKGKFLHNPQKHYHHDASHDAV